MYIVPANPPPCVAMISDCTKALAFGWGFHILAFSTYLYLYLYPYQKAKPLSLCDLTAYMCFICAQDWSRTSTPLRAPPPQDGASTYSATWACCILGFRFWILDWVSEDARDRQSKIPNPKSRDPARARTWDPLIKSQMLCQLSYGIRCLGTRKGRKSYARLGANASCAGQRVGEVFVRTFCRPIGSHDGRWHGGTGRQIGI